jgi:hypothetical protein
MFPRFAICNECAGTPTEAPLDSFITKDDYKECRRSKQFQREHMWEGNSTMAFSSMGTWIATWKCSILFPDTHRATIAISSQRRIQTRKISKHTKIYSSDSADAAIKRLQMQCDQACNAEVWQRFDKILQLAQSHKQMHKIKWNIWINTQNPLILINSARVMYAFFNWYSGGVESNWVHSALRPRISLLCQARVIMMMGKLVE